MWVDGVVLCRWIASCLSFFPLCSAPAQNSFDSRLWQNRGVELSRGSGGGGYPWCSMDGVSCCFVSCLGGLRIIRYLQVACIRMRIFFIIFFERGNRMGHAITPTCRGPWRTKWFQFIPSVCNAKMDLFVPGMTYFRKSKIFAKTANNTKSKP